MQAIILKEMQEQAIQTGKRSPM